VITLRFAEIVESPSNWGEYLHFQTSHMDPPWPVLHTKQIL